ncbi:hypothetical protein ACHAWX_000763 [Stephanocyclus meneghinianus]
MRTNYEIGLSGCKCILVPYRPEHLPNYHEWMKDPFLLDATASEPLTMEQEVEMQQSWREDERKCTFIILARDLLNSNNTCDGSTQLEIPPPPSDEHVDETCFYPKLVKQTLHAMIGDINLFLSEEESFEEVAEYFQESNIMSLDRLESKKPPTFHKAELDLMIAKPSHRHKGIGAELALMMMHFGASVLKIRHFFVKIKDTNTASLRLFRDKLGFSQCAYAECFREYELECKCKTPLEMVKWIENKWASCGVEKSRLYDLFKCPLI